ncbi:MAG: hypothetical protein WC939_04710, partial [Acholeplasmataceae bacterium]
TQFYKKPKVDFINVYYEAGKLNYEINIDPLDSKVDEDSLSIVLSSHNIRHVQKATLGYQSDAFDVDLNRTYRLRVEGDVGLGRQIFRERRITITDTPYVNLRSFAQVNDTLEIYFTMQNTISIKDGKVKVQVLTQLETIYFEELDYTNGINLVIPNIKAGKPYTLRVLANAPSQKKLFEQTILTSDMPVVDAHVEVMQGMAMYMININDFYNRLSGDVVVELHQQRMIEKHTFPADQQRDIFGEFFLDEHPQGVYKVKVYGLVGYKRTLLYEQAIYNAPEALINYTLEDTNILGRIELKEYKMEDYTLSLEVRNQSTNEVTTYPISKDLTFEFEVDLAINYSLTLVLEWNHQTYNISYGFINASVMNATFNLNQYENLIDYQINIHNPTNEIINDILVRITNDANYNMERNYQSVIISDVTELGQFGVYNLALLVNGEVVKEESFYFPPPHELILYEADDVLNVEMGFEGSNINTTAIDLYLNGVLVERQNGLNARFTNLLRNQEYEVRFVIIEGKEYVVKTRMHLFNPTTTLTAIIETVVDGFNINYNFTISNPDNITIDQLSVVLSNETGFVDEATITSDYNGTFTVQSSGEYIISIYHKSSLIGSKSVVILPEVFLQVSPSSYSISANVFLDDPVGHMLFIDLYSNDVLIERQSGIEAEFHNLQNNTLYDVRVVYKTANTENILIQESTLFNPMLGQEEVRLLTADYSYSETENRMILTVDYEHTMSSSDLHYLFLRAGTQNVFTHEFILDGSTLVIPVDNVYPYATAVIVSVATLDELTSLPITNRYDYATFSNISYDGTYLHVTLDTYGPASRNNYTSKVVRHTLNGTTTTYEESFFQSITKVYLSDLGENILEVVIGNVLAGRLYVNIPTTGSLTLRDDGLNLYATPILDSRPNQPIYVQVYKEGTLLQEKLYTTDELTFSDLDIDTILSIRLVVRLDVDLTIYQQDYVVSTLFVEVVYTNNAITLYWDSTYDDAETQNFYYEIFFEDGEKQTGEIDLATPTSNYEISITNTSNSATLVMYAQKQTGLQLLGQRTVYK